MNDNPQSRFDVDLVVEQLIAIMVGHRAEQNRSGILQPSSATGVQDSDPEFFRPYIRETRTSKSLYFSEEDVQSSMLKSDPENLALDYTRTMMGFLLFNPRPQRIAMIGLGGGSLAKFCYRNLPDCQIDVVEINPHVLALRHEFQVPPDDDRFRVHLGDGAQFIAQASARFDVLLVDGYSRDGLPASLSSRTFYGQCRRALGSNGIMVANLNCVDPDEIIDRIRQSFSGTVATVGERDWNNRIVFAFTDTAAASHQPGMTDTHVPTLPRDASKLLRRNFARIVAAMKQL